MGRRFTVLGLALALSLAVSGCAGGTGPFARKPADATAADAQSSTKLVERDVEAPEVFQASDQGLWDGRPSLGGVWVASADVKDPERVIIRNDANGKFVIGALFRRERDNPGPPLQVSSDAADALGMLAGAPAKLNVTALRRDEEPAAPADAPVAAPGVAASIVPEPVTAEPITAQPIDKIAGTAAAALDQAAPAAALAKPTPLTPAPAKSSLDRAYVQIGIFSVEANATATVKGLKKAGIAAVVKKSQASGKEYWRVVAGPARTAPDRAALLAKVKAAGFADAYLVSG